MATERPPATLSVALLLTHGRSNRLFVVHQGKHSSNPNTYGLIAGGAELTDKTALDTGLREALEEANINKRNIIFVKGRNDPRPHVATIFFPQRIEIGLIFDMTYSGKKIPLTGWNVSDKKVDHVTLFSWQDVLKLLEAPERIYRPEFNSPQFIRWLLFNHGGSQKRTIIVDQWFGDHQKTIDGLQQRSSVDRSNLLSRWKYVPPYENWINANDIFGNPKRTNFARNRSKWQHQIS